MDLTLDEHVLLFCFIESDVEFTFYFGYLFIDIKRLFFVIWSILDLVLLIYLLKLLVYIRNNFSFPIWSTMVFIFWNFTTYLFQINHRCIIIRTNSYQRNLTLHFLSIFQLLYFIFRLNLLFHFFFFIFIL